MVAQGVPWWGEAMVIKASTDKSVSITNANRLTTPPTECATKVYLSGRSVCRCRNCCAKAWAWASIGANQGKDKAIKAFRCGGTWAFCWSLRMVRSTQPRFRRHLTKHLRFDAYTKKIYHSESHAPTPPFWPAHLAKLAATEHKLSAIYKNRYASMPPTSKKVNQATESKNNQNTQRET